MPPSDDNDPWMEAKGDQIAIRVCPFFQEGLAAGCACIQRLDKVVYTQAWVLGRDEYSATPPAAVMEGSVLYALSLAEMNMNEHEQSQGFMGIQVGDRRTVHALRARFTGGTLGPKSAMALGTAVKLKEIARKLPGTLILSSTPICFLEKAHPLGSRL